MNRPDTSQNLERRKQVRLRARPNLRCVCRFQGGRRIYVVKDPVALQFYHLEEPQKFALDRMDGVHTLEQIRQEYEMECKPNRLSPGELEGFASQLLQCGLVENDAPSLGDLVHARLEKQRRMRQWSQFANIFYFKVPLLRSTKGLDKLVPVGRFLFHPLVVLTGMLFLLGGIGLVLTRWNDFFDRLPAYQELFTWRNMAYLWLAIGLVKVFHELGHALCARTMGSEVYDLGAAFMFFFPTLYCNVSDSWMLPQKWKRMAIGAAGIYLELLIAGCSVWIWWATAPTTFLHQFSFWVIITCSVHTLLFNANPLMRFDGYFLLSDWMDIPNLNQLAQRQFRYGLKGWLGYEVPQTSNPGPKVFLFFFGLASFLYRLFVVGCTLYLFHQFMKEQRLEWLGLILILVAMVVLAAWPVYRLLHNLRSLRKVSPMKPLRFWFSLALVGCLLGLFFLVPFSLHVSGVGLVQVEAGYQQCLLVPTPGGFLVQTFGRDGQPVKKGDILAVLRNPKIDLELRLNEADQALRAEQLQALTGQMAIHNDPRAEWDSRLEIQQELHTLAQQHATFMARVGDLTLRAPCDGILMGFPSWEVLGKWISEGTPLCKIGDDRQLRLLVLLEPADRQLIAKDKPIGFRCHGISSVTWQGQVTSAAQVDARDIPVQLSLRLGGDIASKPDPVEKTEKPDKQHYLVSAKIQDVDKRIQVGTLGQVRLDAGSQTCWWRLRRYLGSTFHWWL